MGWSCPSRRCACLSLPRRLPTCRRARRSWPASRRSHVADTISLRPELDCARVPSHRSSSSSHSDRQTSSHSPSSFLASLLCLAADKSGLPHIDASPSRSELTRDRQLTTAPARAVCPSPPKRTGVRLGPGPRDRQSICATSAAPHPALLSSRALRLLPRVFSSLRNHSRPTADAHTEPACFDCAARSPRWA